jgi:carbamoyltransferase
MITCGLKLTHDGAIALLDGDRLVFSVEMEKLANNLRYSPVTDLSAIPEVLASFGYAVSDVDEWVIDGWDGDKTGFVELLNQGDPVSLTLAPYRESQLHPDILRAAFTESFPLPDGQSYPYTSYVHIAGHLASAYCTSEFARERAASLILVWDGGLFPRLYWLDPDEGVTNGGELFPLIGHSYAMAAHHFGPYRRDHETQTVDDLSVAGKMMAYIALGRPQEAALRVLRDTYIEHFEADTPRVAEYRQRIGGFGSNAEPSHRYVHAFYRDVRGRLSDVELTDADILASVHQLLEDLLIEKLTARVTEWKGPGPWNLCFVGGCALNIKWNSALRALPLFTDVWVPPFPNDSGSAIGAAALGMIRYSGCGPIRWHVRSGPAVTPVVTPADLPDGWSAEPCPPARLARVLHETGEPVVLLDGRAELGPRALGGRSIIATAVDPAMKDHLNEIKDREGYRPVAPVCLVEHAPEIFDPGTPDPYMLFDHMIRPPWTDRIPAVRHLDGTARLQTVSERDDPVLAEVLREYHSLSGIPVLCNTSANFHGRGFFPDVASVMRWGRVRAIWNDGTLYRQVSA